MKKNAAHQADFFHDMNREWLLAARKAAIRIAKEKGQVSSDDVRRECPITGAIHRNVCGKVFKTADFIWSGVKKSTTKTRKGGMIGVYTLKIQN